MHKLFSFAFLYSWRNCNVCFLLDNGLTRSSLDYEKSDFGLKPAPVCIGLCMPQGVITSICRTANSFKKKS